MFFNTLSLSCHYVLEILRRSLKPRKCSLDGPLTSVFEPPSAAPDRHCGVSSHPPTSVLYTVGFVGFSVPRAQFDLSGLMKVLCLHRPSFRRLQELYFTETTQSVHVKCSGRQRASTSRLGIVNSIRRGDLRATQLKKRSPKGPVRVHLYLP